MSALGGKLRLRYHPLNLLRIHWTAEIVALATITFQPKERIPNLLAFYSFGNALETELGREVDNGLDNDFTVSVLQRTRARSNTRTW
jgi:hypothetical protein